MTWLIAGLEALGFVLLAVRAVIIARTSSRAGDALTGRQGPRRQQVSLILGAVLLAILITALVLQAATT